MRHNRMGEKKIAGQQIFSKLNFYTILVLCLGGFFSLLLPSIHRFQLAYVVFSQINKSRAVVMAVILVICVCHVQIVFFDSYPLFYLLFYRYLLARSLCVYNYAHAHRKQWASQFKMIQQNCLPSHS